MPVLDAVKIVKFLRSLKRMMIKKELPWPLPSLNCSSRNSNPTILTVTVVLLKMEDYSGSPKNVP